MSKDNSIDSLFKEHSFEEIESVRDNIASEIEKRTELLKSIVKEKYRDIVETSDAIQSMKLNLKEVEQSLWSLDKTIANFYTRVKEPQVVASKSQNLNQAQEQGQPNDESKVDTASKNGDQAIKKLLEYSSAIWEHFDSGNLREGVKLLNESMHLLEENRNDPLLNKVALNNLEITFNRAREIIKNNLWHKIQVAAPDQLGIIAGSDQEDLYQLSLVSSVEFLVEDLRSSLSDTSYHAQIRRHQPFSYFNSQTNKIEEDIKSTEGSTTTSYTHLPKNISPELDTFLYKICKIVNTIAGFNLNRSSIVESLRITIDNAMKVYRDIIPMVSLLKADTKRKRALQLYFDLLYLRILLNTSKNIDLIEKLDPQITELASKYELLLDSIELYTISAALHTNVMKLSQSTIRVYGLLIPHLQ